MNEVEMNEVEMMVQGFIGQDRPLIILAPHPDDEIIGCHLLLQAWPGKKHVWFFSGTDRLLGNHSTKEIDILVQAYNLDYEWIELGDELERSIRAELPTNPVYAVPNTLDLHPLHRRVTKEFHQWVNPFQDVIYYSVSKNTDTLIELPSPEIDIKKEILRDVYPREKLWEKDESFVLFESYQRLPGTQWVWVTTDFIAHHCWPDAPDSEGFLRHPHRHLFKVKLGVSVEHDDREIEFFNLQRALNAYIAMEFNGRELNAMSCEMIATHIARHITTYLPGLRRIEVTVSEDGENGATIRW